MRHQRHALIYKATGIVVDIIFIDATGAHGEWPVLEGHLLIDTGDFPINAGDHWDGTKFVHPPGAAVKCAHLGPPTAPPRALTKEEVEAVLRGESLPISIPLPHR
jgi:hypothetical protein